MEKFKIIEKGYIKINENRIGHSDTIERVYNINNVDCVCLSGRTTANGIENWFYNIDEFKIKNNELIVLEFLPNPIYKLKNKYFENTKWGYSVDIEKEEQYKRDV